MRLKSDQEGIESSFNFLCSGFERMLKSDQEGIESLERR